MSTIKTKNIQQKVISGTTQPLKLGGILDDGSDAVITIDTNKVLSGVAVNYIVTIPYTSWIGSSAPYSKSITVNGILSTDKPKADVYLSGVYSTDIQMLNDWASIYRFVSSTNTLTFYSTNIPQADIVLQLEVVR